MTATEGRDVVVAYLDAVGRLDLPAIEATFAEDVELVLPYAPPGFPKVSHGRTKAMEVYPEGVMEPMRFADYRIDALEGRPGEFVAEYTSDTTVLPTGRPYRNTYISRFSVRDGRITRLAEFFDPVVLVTALGGEVRMP
ncbi:Ketosteroid isomerase-related protein [Geodermatophilus telluris]|uniref:Ketosteroid isomerase-related protein n=1 Tax=Geodermatophilus telluris TaxID=1190417 RepID=A0A1G6NVQ2_9ACTN|nr:nuclear transport factor 2 family protein [Geodermatophilus telluris]SDC72110.1 Ketosteroid isomerase-related protein [Geodermatophilus telluris]